MRVILFFFFAWMAVATAGAQTIPSAEAVLKPVYAKAGVEGKNILLIFHASWCGWCRKMDASLQDPAIKPAIDRNYEIAHLTVHESANKKALENPGAIEFLKKNGGENSGLPFWLVLDKNGNVLANSQRKPAENTGCPASEEEVAYFLQVLKKTSSMSPDELEAIRKRFRQNE